MMKRTDTPLAISLTVTGDVAASVRALAFITGKSLEEIAGDTLQGIADRAYEGAELFHHSSDIDATTERFKAYRDANGLDYPDHAVAADVAMARGEITELERDRRAQATIADPGMLYGKPSRRAVKTRNRRMDRTPFFVDG